MAREIAYLFPEVTSTDMCPGCYHMTIANMEVTVVTENGVNGKVPIRRTCQECHSVIFEEGA